VQAELFPAHIRALGVALPYALANTLFGGTAEYVALWLKHIGMEGGFYWYVTALIGVSLLVFASLLIVTGYTSINAVVQAELFPAHIRALGVALPYALANTLFGGTAEYVALWFKERGIESAFYWYVTAMIGLSLIVYLTMRDTKRHSLIAED